MKKAGETALEATKKIPNKNTVTFRVNKYEELQKIFAILEVKPLNTTKYLNYIAFKEALLQNSKTQVKRSLRSRSGRSRCVAGPSTL